MTIKLPPKPKPDIFSHVVTTWRDGVECEIDKGPRYTVEQMEAYAREAVRLNMAEERERIAAHFDDRDRGHDGKPLGVGFYEPHEPAEIIRSLGPNTHGIKGD